MIQAGPIVETAAVISVGLAYVIRSSTLGHIHKQALAELEPLRHDIQLSLYSLPQLDDPGALAARRLNSALKRSAECERAARSDAATLKIPDVGSLDNVQALNGQLGAVQVKFGQLAKSTMVGKVRSIVKNEATHHLHQTVKHIRHTPLKHGPGEQMMVDCLDDFGVIAAAHSLGDAAAEVIPTGVIDAATGLLDAGMFSATKSGIKEMGILFEGEASLTESFQSGLLPTAAQSGAIAVGATIDTLFGWMTFGFFTFAGGWVGSKMKRSLIEPEIRADEAAIQELATKREGKFRTMVNRITTTARNYIDSYRRVASRYCRLENEPEMHKTLSAIAAASQKDASVARALVDDLITQKIKGIRPNNWLERLIRVNRREIVSSYYKSCGESIKDQIGRMGRGVAPNPNRANNDYAQDVSMDLTIVPTLRGGEMQKRVQALPSEVGPILNAHSDRVDSWAAECQTAKSLAIKQIVAVSDLEQANFREFKSSIQPTLDHHIRRRRNNLQRLGVKV